MTKNQTLYGILSRYCIFCQRRLSVPLKKYHWQKLRQSFKTYLILGIIGYYSDDSSTCRYNYSTRYFLIKYRNKCRWQSARNITPRETVQLKNTWKFYTILCPCTSETIFHAKTQQDTFRFCVSVRWLTWQKFKRNLLLMKFPTNVNIGIATWCTDIWSLRLYILSIIFAYNRMWLLFPVAGLRTCRLALIEQTQQSRYG